MRANDSASPDAVDRGLHYEHAGVAVRANLVDAHRRAWRRLAAAGSWWRGGERVAIARETRRAAGCPLCAARREALSPYATPESHAPEPPLSAAAVDAVHRITTDSGRLARHWRDGLREAGLDDGAYVELIGVVVTVVSIDAFCRALGVPPHPLPTPLPGEPSRYRPARATREGAWVPMIPAFGARGAEADLWRPGATANVIRALSLVPDEVRTLKDLSAAHYLPAERVADPTARMAHLTRAQMELVAARMSALRECFY
jgi:hypothetical protein